MTKTNKEIKKMEDNTKVEEIKKIEISEEVFNKLIQEINDLKKTTTEKKEEKWVGTINKTNKKSPLIPGKKVTIIPLSRGATNFIDDPEQATMLRGTGKSIKCPLHSKIYKLVDPLNDEEREYLEEALGVNLNVYSKDNDGFLNSFYTKREGTIRFKKKGFKLDSAQVTLDLGDPYEYLLFKIALINPRVANKWEDRNNPNYHFVIKDEYSELAEDMKFTKQEDTVLKYLYSIETNKKALYDLLRLYGASQKQGLKIDNNKSIEWLYNELKKISKTNKGIKELYNIISLNDKSPKKLNDMILIQDAIECGALEKRGNNYQLPGGEVVGYGLNETIEYLGQNINQEVRLRIISKIEKYLNK